MGTFPFLYYYFILFYLIFLGLPLKCKNFLLALISVSGTIKSLFRNARGGVGNGSAGSCTRNLKSAPKMWHKEIQIEM